MAARSTRCGDSRRRRSIRSRPGGVARRAEFVSRGNASGKQRNLFLWASLPYCKRKGMASDFLTQANWAREGSPPAGGEREAANLFEAERALQELAEVFLQQSLSSHFNLDLTATPEAATNPEAPLLNMEAKYRALVE